MAEIPQKEEQDACTCEVTARGACHVGEIQRPDKTYSLPPQEFRVLRGNMKSLRVLSGISMDLVYHVGRHSFASLVTLEEGVPIETISRMLGHNNIQTTQIYARVTPKSYLRIWTSSSKPTRTSSLSCNIITK